MTQPDTRKQPLAPKEKRLLLATLGLCALFALAPWLYERNNRVPSLLPDPPLPQPNAFDFYQAATKAFVAPSLNSKIDRHLDTSTPSDPPALYSPDCNRLYPPSRKRAYLRANARALRLLRQGFAFRYAEPPSHDGKIKPAVARMRDIARLLIVEAHEKAQRGDWDGAGDSLLDILHLGYDAPRQGPLTSSLSGDAIRKMATEEFWPLLPHLSAAKARQAARRLEALRTTQWTMAQTLESEKRATGRVIVELIRSRDLRPLYVIYGCIEGCGVSKEEYQRALDEVPRWRQIRLAWMNKPRLLSEYNHCLDWQIANVRRPYPSRLQKWPFPETDDAVQQMIYPRFTLTLRNRAALDARIALLTAALALHVYKQQTGRYPTRLSELVPSSLAQVPRDPFTDNQPLRYAPRRTRYVAQICPPLFPLGPSQPVPLEDVPSGMVAGEVFVAPKPIEESKEIYAHTPYTLYSVGFNSRDDEGEPYEDKASLFDLNRRYGRLPRFENRAAGDIVAHINR